MLKYFIVYIFVVCPSGYKGWTIINDTHSFEEANAVYERELGWQNWCRKENVTCDDRLMQKWERYQQEWCTGVDVKIESGVCDIH